MILYFIDFLFYFIKKNPGNGIIINQLGELFINLSVTKVIKLM